MSFLLDALRKSEQQRRLGETPSIQVPILGRAESKPRRSRKVLLALGLVVIVMLLWLVFLQYNSTDDDSLVNASSSDTAGSTAQAEVVTQSANRVNGNEPATQSSSSETTTQPSTPRPAPNNPVANATPQPSASNNLPSALSEQNQEQAVSNFDELANQIAEREARAREIRQQQAAQQEQLAEQQQAAQLIPQQAATQADAKPEQLTTTSPDATTVEDEWEPAKPAYLNYFELPLNVRQSLPEFSVSIRVFDEVPEKRFVIIGRERVFEGDEIPGADGVELVEIKRQSLILEYQGYVFESQ